MASHVLQAYNADIRYRIDGLQPANDLGWRVNAHTLDDGVVFEDDKVCSCSTAFIGVRVRVA